MEKEKQRIAELIKEGGVLQIIPDVPKGFLLGGVAYLEDGIMRWSPVFPFDQGDLHNLRFDELRFHADKRDVGVYLKGKMVAYITTILESPHNTDVSREAFFKWKRLVEMPHNKEHFQEFLSS